MLKAIKYPKRWPSPSCSAITVVASFRSFLSRTMLFASFVAATVLLGLVPFETYALPEDHPSQNYRRPDHVRSTSDTYPDSGSSTNSGEYPDPEAGTCANPGSPTCVAPPSATCPRLQAPFQKQQDAFADGTLFLVAPSSTRRRTRPGPRRRNVAGPPKTTKTQNQALMVANRGEI